MNINNELPVTTNFKGINREVMKDFAKLPRKYREDIARNYKILENSDVVDLTYGKDKKDLVLKIKKTVAGILPGYEDLPAGTEIGITANTEAMALDHRLGCRELNMVGNLEYGEKAIHIDFGSESVAQDIAKDYEFEGSIGAHKLPTLGTFIDTAYRMHEPLEKIKSIIKKIKE